MKRLLITGASGTLGRVVAAQALAAGWEVVGTYHTAPLPMTIAWQRLDVGDRVAVVRLVQAMEPHAIVHTAMVQRGPTLWSTTADGAAHIALAAQKVGARLVHISSDALFDGTQQWYDEQAAPSPVNPYGAAKAAAETAVAAIRPTAAIVRTSLIMSHDPLDQHSQMIMDIARGRRGERLFTDEYRCPVPVDDLAAAVLELVANDFAGIINVAGADAVSRYELGCVVAERHGVDSTLLATSTVAESGLRRPADVRLDSSLARRSLRTRLRGVREFMRPVAANDPLRHKKDYR